MLKKLIYLLTIACVCFGLLPVYASTPAVIDTTGTLSQSAVDELTSTAEQLSAQYSTGIYIRIYSNTEGMDTESYSEYIYEQENLGADYDGNMILFILTMEDRTYDISGHGSIANTAFTDYARQQIADACVPYLSSGNYEQAFTTFLSYCKTDLQAAANGAPVDHSSSSYSDPYYYNDPVYQQQQRENDLFTRKVIVFSVPPAIALLVCMILKSKNKNIGIARTAGNYASNLNLTNQRDIFLYRTTQRTPIPRNNPPSGGGGGTSVNSGGFSHSSGHF